MHVVTNSGGRFRVRLAKVPACRAWTVRALGARGGRAVYRRRACSAKDDVEGVVRRAPITPTCVPGRDCSAPAAGVTVKASDAQGLVAETTTDGGGRFALSLAPGYYTISAVGRGAEPRDVRVTTSNVVHVSFVIDSGIR